MTHNDSRFKRAIKKETPQMPADMAARFDDTIATFQGHASRRHGYVWVLRFAVFFLVVFLALPNISPTIAYAMQEIPVIGDIVRVFTIYKLEERDDNHYQDIEIPQIDATEGNNAAIDYINADVDAITKAVIEEYEATVEELPDAHMGLLIDYEVLTNTDTWFTLRLLILRDAGSTTVEYHYYHIDKQLGTLVELSDLFKADYDYQEVLSTEIKAQMRQQIADNPQTVYWIDENNGINYVFEEIAGDQNFYFNSNGELVIVFGKYEVAPGYMGCPEFVIPANIYVDGWVSVS